MNFRDEQGYTLVETVVAMSIFLGVVIPLVSALGDFMMDSKATLTRKALFIAESEMSKVESDHQFSNLDQKLEGGFILARRVYVQGRLADVRVSVSDPRRSDKEVVVLNKSILTE